MTSGSSRLATPVPCSVARPAGLRRDSPDAGTVVSRWSYGVCGKEPSRKRMRHFRRGGPTFMLRPGDSGEPTVDPQGRVYQINSGHYTVVNKDNVARVEKVERALGARSRRVEVPRDAAPRADPQIPFRKIFQE